MNATRIKITYADGSSEERALTSGDYVIGRDTGDIVLNDPNTSAVHAVLSIMDGQATITDQNSTNGVLDENGVRVGAAYPLSPNQPVRLGGCLLTAAQLSPAAGGTQLMPQFNELPKVHDAANVVPLTSVPAVQQTTVPAVTAAAAAGVARRGTVIKVPDQTPGLLVVNGQQYSFQLEGVWCSAVAPAANQVVDVVLNLAGSIVAIMAVDSKVIAKEKVADLGSAAQEHARQAAAFAKRGANAVLDDKAGNRRKLFIGAAALGAIAIVAGGASALGLPSVFSSPGKSETVRIGSSLSCSTCQG